MTISANYVRKSLAGRVILVREREVRLLSTKEGEASVEAVFSVTHKGVTTGKVPVRISSKMGGSAAAILEKVLGQVTAIVGATIPADET